MLQRFWRAPLLLGVLAVTFLGLPSSDADVRDILLRAADAPVVRGTWRVVTDSTAAGGRALSNPNAGAARVATPLSSPANYFELTFEADPATAYRLWIRGKAASNNWANDSVYVQFSDSVTSTGAATWRIGSTSATTVTIEQCSGCGLSGWGWSDNGFASLGDPVYFSGTGTHTMRVQVREDGLTIDQIVLSPATYFTTAPGAAKNDTTILAGGTPPPAPSSIALVREPFVQQVSGSSATIVWASREPGPASVRANAQSFAATSTLYPATRTGLSYDYYQHEATVGGLAPATSYAYDVFVGSTDVNATADQFRTAPASGSGTVRFIAFGDSGTGSTAQRTLASVMASDTFDLAVHTGDIAYGNSGGTGDATYATFQSWFFDIYEDWLRRRPFFPSPGNHDTRLSNNWGRAYLDVFVLPEDAGAGSYPDHAERYYSYDYGPVHFVSLDTERAFQDTTRRAEQLRWLEADLAATTQPWKIVYFHRSPYSSGEEHGPDPVVQGAFGPLFERYGVQLVISGHDHGYERSVPWRASTDRARQAVTYVVAGGGGGPLYPMGRSAWTAASASRHNYVRTTVSGCTARIEAVGTSGEVFDATTLDRCAQATDAGVPQVSFASPASGATVSGTVTVEANADDDVRVEKVDLWVDGRLHAIDTAAPYEFTWNTTGLAAGSHALELRAYDIDGNRSTRTQAVTVTAGGATAGDIVIHAADLPSSAIVGSQWSMVADSTAAGGVRLYNPNRGLKLAASASPSSYVQVTFDAEAGVPYHVWLRMKADSNHYDNDSVSLQFDGTVTTAGTATDRIGTTEAMSVILEEGRGAGVRGWGWNDGGYGTLGAHVYFARSGAQRLLIQTREDGVSLDQIVISPATYLTRAPGALKDDTTIVPR